MSAPAPARASVAFEVLYGVGGCALYVAVQVAGVLLLLWLAGKL